MLRDTDLAAVNHMSVVGHVLRLEWRHPNSPPGKMPADGGGNQALACPARGPLHHQRTHIGRPGKEVLSLAWASLGDVTASRERLHRREQWTGKTIPATPLPRCGLLRFQCPRLSA